MTMADPTAPARGIPLNEVDKLFYLGEQYGARTFNRFLFEFAGGRVDGETLRRAYLLAVQRRPVLNARVVDRPAGAVWNAAWVPRGEADAARAVRLLDFSAMSGRAADAAVRELQADLFPDYCARTDPPFFLALCNGPGGRQTLLIFVSHILTDGYGASLITEELFGLYNQVATGGAPQEWACREPYQQAVPLLPASRLRRCLLVLGAVAAMAGQAVKSGFQPAAKLFPGGSGFSDPIAIARGMVPQERLSRCLAAAKCQGVSFNAFAIAALFLAIDRWKRECGEPAGLISIDVPVNLRAGEHELRGLSNKMSAFNIAAHPRHRRRPLELLHRVRRLQETARKNRTAEKLSSLLWLLETRRGVGLLQRRINGIFNNPNTASSLSVSNMGRLWETPGAGTRLSGLGDAEITACYGSGQPNPATGAIMTIQTFHDRLYLTVAYFRKKATDEQAQRFVALVEQELDGLADLALGAQE